jgi:hypothetical protein
MALQRCSGIDVERCADRLGDLGNGDVLGMKDAVSVLEMVHGLVP